MGVGLGVGWGLTHCDLPCMPRPHARLLPGCTFAPCIPSPRANGWPVFSDPVYCGLEYVRDMPHTL